MKKRSSRLWVGLLCLFAVSQARAIDPPPGLGTVPFDHDKFLQFAESHRADSVASADAYYETVDPSDLRTTLDDWKALNGFVEPLPNTPAGLASLGIAHALYRNATDLGFVRNIYMRVKPNGDVVALLENFASFERTLHRSFDEVNDGCSTAFDPGLPPEQQCTSGGVDAFENRDLSGMLASVVMEYSAVATGGPKFTQFYGYNNAGDRVAALDLTGRGKAEAFPGLCAVCHGGNPGGIDGGGAFVAPDPALPGSEDGNFGGGFLPWDPDLYEFHDPLAAGADVGSGTYSRANQESFFKDLNAMVLLTNPTPAARELIEGFYGGPGLPGSFDSNFVPLEWSWTPESTTFYQTVLAPYCRACHIQRGFPENTPNVNTRTTRLDFNSWYDFEGLHNQIGRTVFSRTTMPMALVTYKKFWSDGAAVANLIAYLEQDGYPEVIPTVDDGFGNLVAVMPGKPIAAPGSYVQQTVNVPIQLDGSASLSADHFAWSVMPSAGVTLLDPTTATPTFSASTPGDYTITLTVSNDAVTDGMTVIRPADTSDPVSTTITVVDAPFSRVTFESAIRPSPTNARCLNCHSLPDVAGYEDFNEHGEMTKMAERDRYIFVEGNLVSRLLVKPAALWADFGSEDGVHNGGKILRTDDAYYARLESWIDDGECFDERGCQRLSVTNADTPLVIDPLSPFMDASLLVRLTAIQPGHGSLSLTPEQELLYTPAPGFAGLDTYHYTVMDPATGSSRLVTDRILVFPAVDTVPYALHRSFASQSDLVLSFPDPRFEFEKINSDGDALPNYVDDFPNDPLIGRDQDGDGLPDGFNANVSSAEALASGIVTDSDDDGDGVPDASDDVPLDAARSVYLDSDRDGVEDADDPYPFDMTGTVFEGFESGDLSALPWTTSGTAGWQVVATPEALNSPQNAGFFVQSPVLGESNVYGYDEFATLSVTLTVNSGALSFWYFASIDEAEEDIWFFDGTRHDLPPTNGWTRVSFPVGAGTHTFEWGYSDYRLPGEGGLHALWIDDIEFSGPADSDSDGASDALDNCPTAANTTQTDSDSDGLGDACDAGDFDGDGLSDAEESVLGSDPAVTDSDGDGVDDGADAFVLDPAASLDSDGDGIPDTLAGGAGSTSQPPLHADLEPFGVGGLDSDGDGVGDDSIHLVSGTGTYGYSGDGGPAVDADLAWPEGLALDAMGNLFIGDSDSARVRRVDAATGIITTVAGTGTHGYNGDGGLASAAQLSYPSGLATDAAGNLFIADAGNARVRRVDAVTGIITTVAGDGTYGLPGDGGPATSAHLDYPEGLVLDSLGNLFIADSSSCRVRRVDASTGIITTVAGDGSYGYSGDGGLATSAQLDGPQAVAVDALGDVFIADSSNYRVRRVDAATGVITTVAGNGTSGDGGDGGPATSAPVESPRGLALDASGSLFISEWFGHRVRRLDLSTGIITTVTGVGTYGYAGDGGLAVTAQLSYPKGLAIDALGRHLFIAESGNARVRVVVFSDPRDAFPFDPAASVDSDGDGFPDAWNAGATPEQIAASGLLVDAFPSDPTAAIDSDGDGWPDQFVIGAGIVSPIVLAEDLDDDGDGLADLVETGTGVFVSATDTGTDPLVADTDADGSPDGEEVAAGSDPTNPASLPPGQQVPALPMAALVLLAALLGLVGSLQRLN